MDFSNLSCKSKSLISNPNYPQVDPCGNILPPKMRQGLNVAYETSSKKKNSFHHSVLSPAIEIFILLRPGTATERQCASFTNFLYKFLLFSSIARNLKAKSYKALQWQKDSIKRIILRFIFGRLFGRWETFTIRLLDVRSTRKLFYAILPLSWRDLRESC